MGTFEQTVDRFNDFLVHDRDTSVRLVLSGDVVYLKVPDDFIVNEDQIFTLSDEFYDLLEEHFEKAGFDVMYNNVRSVFWSR